MYQTMGFTYKNRNNRKQNPLKLRLRRSKVIGSISTTINNDIIDKKPPPKAAKKITGVYTGFENLKIFDEFTSVYTGIYTSNPLYCIPNMGDGYIDLNCSK